MTNYARLETRSASLATPFGLDWATKLFGEEVVSQLGTYSRGPRKGLTKGCVHWVNCLVGGWSRAYGVVTPGKAVRAWLAPSDFSPETDAFRVQLNGRVQGCCLSRRYLFEDGRARLAAERQAELASARAVIDDRIQELAEVVTALRAALADEANPLVGPVRQATENLLARNQQSLDHEQEALRRLAA